jgi:UDP-glucose 4-epimerase
VTFDRTIQECKVRYFVTGCAGFIGSTLTERLLADGHSVVGYDNLSTGQEQFLARALDCTRFRLVRGDILDSAALAAAMEGADLVFHLAAHADVRFGTLHPGIDLEQNAVGTHRVLEGMRQQGIRRIAFASSGSVYGDARLIPTPEDAPFPIQTSLYGASKCAAESLIAAYSAGFGFQAHIFRFVSILGERYTHGHVFDFFRQLEADPTRLCVLGDGRQRKSYLYVGDCIEAMLLALDQPGDALRIFNLGTQEHCEVRESIAWICEALGVAPDIVYGGGACGWIGDNPFLLLDTARIRALGWRPALSIRAAVGRTVAYLRAHTELLERRA